MCTFCFERRETISCYHNVYKKDIIINPSYNLLDLIYIKQNKLKTDIVRDTTIVIATLVMNLQVFNNRGHFHGILNMQKKSFKIFLDTKSFLSSSLEVTNII